MIRFSSFSLLDNFARYTYEFDDEKILIKTKSLKIEADYHCDYVKIKVIEVRRVVDLSWLFALFLFLTIMLILNFVLDYALPHNLTIQSIEKTLIILGYIGCALFLRERVYYSFLDSDRNRLFTIEATKANMPHFHAAMALLKEKTELISATDIASPFPERDPAFELVQRTIPDYLNTSIARFYDDGIVEWEKSLVEEVVTEVKYSQMSGEADIFRMGSYGWDHLWNLWFLLIVIASDTVLLFFPNIFRIYPPATYLFAAAWLLIIPLFLLRYLKEEHLAFYDKHNDRIIYWLRRDKASSHTLDQIVAFIKERTDLAKTGTDARK